MAKLIIFLSIFVPSIFVLYRFRKKLSLLLVAVAAFFVAVIPSSFFPDEKASVLLDIDKLITSLLSRLTFINSIFLILFVFLSFYIANTVKIVKEGNAAIVQRLGRYHRMLNPGLNFVVPFLDVIALAIVRTEKGES